jgi:flagellar hook-associated protein 3 FlgL
MPILPLAPGAFRATNSARILTETRATLDDLQRQLATGQKSQTYGGLGTLRLTSLDFRAKISESNAWQQSITHAQIRVKQYDLGLTQISKSASTLRSSTILPQFEPDASGKTPIQNLVRLNFDEAIDILNSDINGSYLYSGRSSDVRPVVDAKTILEGDAAGRAGVRQLVAERKAADFGVAPNQGRIINGGAGTTATLTEDGAHPFGLKIAAGSSTTTDITSAFAAGPPAGISFNVAANPAPGSEVRVLVRFPDNSEQTITLTAKTAPLSPTGGAGEFEIGATPAATAQNLRDALTAAVDRESVTTLPAASANKAAQDFFAGTATSPPLRVVGPPATATAQIAGTAANTVIWYQGDHTAPNPRNTANVRIDQTQTVGVGAQANEQGIARALGAMAVFAVETFANTSDDKGRYQALSDRLKTNLSSSGGGSIQSIQIEISLAASTMKDASERHRARSVQLENVVSDIENTNQEETASKLLSLQTKMQTAYQTTAILSRLNLTEYLR